MPEKPPVFKPIKVTEGDKEMTVFVPDTGDREWNHDLMQTAIEKTREDLAKKPSRPTISEQQKEDRRLAVKDYTEYSKRKREGGRRYY